MEEDDFIPNQFDDGNRAFLQAFLARGSMTLKEARPILASIFSAQEKLEKGEDAEPTAAGDVTVEDVESYVSAASAAASPFDMEIRSARHQATGERVWALVNTTSDPQTQLATLYSAEEMVFVRRVLDAMFDKFNTPRMEMMCLDGMQANKLRSAPRESNAGENNNDDEDEDGQPQQTQSLKGLKSSEVEHVMRTMVESGWFDRSRDGFYSLSARALMELRGWLVDMYNGNDEEDEDDGEDSDNAWQRVKFCEACRDVVTYGQRCAERDCLVRLHDACAEAFWRGNSNNAGANRNGGSGGGGRPCPRCAKEWTGRHFVGERAVTQTEAYQRGKRRSGRGGGRNSSIVEQIVEEAEEEEDGDGDTE
ncbi:Nse1 non-SMC component of SMC5-6 complex-domain-containing protein [Hypoxylon sp. FL1284]|nr:Nse1 non-SMC component of SMC5-6 complex-domain-containing protein [Hypoxylon sp. FL1284]